MQTTFSSNPQFRFSAKKRVKRLPVVDAEGELVGIAGRTEMMRALLANSVAID